MKSKVSLGARKSAETKKFNIGSLDDPKMVNTGKCCSQEEKKKVVNMLKRYVDVLAYSYDDLKDFHPKEMQHFIPLKPGIKPFKKKQRQYNLKIADTIFQEIQNLLK
ncbi:hypothetical protein KI387_038483, partial [Taxus chinensis]